MQEKRSTAFQMLIDENMKLRDEICELKRRLHYIELLAKGMVHWDLQGRPDLKVIERFERSTK